MVASQPTAAGDPAEATLDNPPPGLHCKAFLALLGFDDLDRDGRGHASALASIGTVGKAVGQEGERSARGSKQGNRAVAVVQVSG